MIKNYKQFESLLDKLEGPTETEMYDSFNKLSPDIQLKKMLIYENDNGIKLAIERGADKSIVEKYNKLKKEIIDEIKTFKKIEDKGFKNTIFYCNKYGVQIEYEKNYKSVFGRGPLITIEIALISKMKNGLDINNKDTNKFWENILNNYLNIKVTTEHITAFMFNPIHWETIENEYLNESLLNKLEGPSTVEFDKTLSVMEPYMALELSIENGYLDGVKKYIDSIKGKGSDIDRLLFKAVDSNNVEIVEILINNGADINCEDSLPLFFAVENDDIDMVKFILKHYDENDYTLDDVNIDDAIDVAYSISDENIEKLLDKYKKILDR